MNVLRCSKPNDSENPKAPNIGYHERKLWICDRKNNSEKHLPIFFSNKLRKCTTQVIYYMSCVSLLKNDACHIEPNLYNMIAGIVIMATLSASIARIRESKIWHQPKKRRPIMVQILFCFSELGGSWNLQHYLFSMTYTNTTVTMMNMSWTGRLWTPMLFHAMVSLGLEVLPQFF